MPAPGPAARPRASSDPRGRLGRLLGVVELGVGCLLTLRPKRVAAVAAGPNGMPAAGWLVRALGLRSVLQGAMTAVAPTRAVLLGGALVDATHAASMAPVMAASPRYRRAATVSALAAAVSAAAGATAARRLAA